MTCVVLVSASSASGKASSPCLASLPGVTVITWPFLNVVKLAVLHSSGLESSDLPVVLAATAHFTSKRELLPDIPLGHPWAVSTSAAGHLPMYCLALLGIAALIASPGQPTLTRAIRGMKQRWAAWDPPTARGAHPAGREATNDTNDIPAAHPIIHKLDAGGTSAYITAGRKEPTRTCANAAAASGGAIGILSTLPDTVVQSPVSGSAQRPTYPILVKTPKTLAIHVCRTDTVTDILRKIQDREGILFDRLQLGSVRLPLEQPLADLGVVRDVTLHAFIDLKGGGSFMSTVQDSGDGSADQHALPPRVQSTSPSQPNSCGAAACTNPTPFRCNACQLQWYCSREHQALDWSRHEAECLALCDPSRNVPYRHNMPQSMSPQGRGRGWAYSEAAANPAAPPAARALTLNPAAPHGCGDPVRLRLEDEDGPLTRLPALVVEAGLWRPVTHADLPFIVGRRVRLRAQPVISGVVVNRGDDRFFRLLIGIHGWHFAGDLDVYVLRNGDGHVAVRAEPDGCEDPTPVHEDDW